MLRPKNLRALPALLLFSASLGCAHAYRGADVPWTIYEAENMKTTGTELSGMKSGTNTVAWEASGQKCVQLAAAGQYVEFTARASANAIVVRYSLPDAPAGGGIDSTINLFKNGKFLRKIPVTSRYSYLYGHYPFTNNPAAGIPRNFYDEVRVKDLSVKKGDALRLQKGKNDSAPFCVIDLVDLENVAPPLAAPINSLSILDFDASGNGQTDDTAALRKCLAAARGQNKIVWVPAGNYKITGDINLPSHSTIQGAGMWQTAFVGDAALYNLKVHGRVRFEGRGDDIHLADFAIIGRLNYRNDSEENDGITGFFGAGSGIARLWIEHTKTGLWLMNSSNLVVDSCRLRDTLADGINFCVGMRNSIIENCATRGTGDDCFAMWPAVFLPQQFSPGFNVIRHCTGQLPFLANGGALYGGQGNRIEDSRFTDISYGCGILISTTFPVANEKVDNNFSGTTMVENCDLIRCGGMDHEWGWRAALQLCLDGNSISGIALRDLNIAGSISDGLSIIGPRKKDRREGTLSNAVIKDVNIPNYGLEAKGRHGLWIAGNVHGSLAIADSKIVEIKNSSADFTIMKK